MAVELGIEDIFQCDPYKHHSQLTEDKHSLDIKPILKAFNIRSKKSFETKKELLALLSNCLKQEDSFSRLFTPSKNGKRIGSERPKYHETNQKLLQIFKFAMKYPGLD